jgi:hypothetical protein
MKFPRHWRIMTGDVQAWGASLPEHAGGAGRVKGGVAWLL